MPRGKTSISLKGGKGDGVYLEDVATIGIRDTLSYFTGGAFTEEPNGKVGIWLNLEEIPANWISYKTHIYAKTVNDKSRKGVVYEFQNELMVERCASYTKAGQRCKNESLDGSQICHTHSRSLAHSDS